MYSTALPYRSFVVRFLLAQFLLNLPASAPCPTPPHDLRKVPNNQKQKGWEGIVIFQITKQNKNQQKEEKPGFGPRVPGIQLICQNVVFLLSPFRQEVLLCPHLYKWIGARSVRYHSVLPGRAGSYIKHHSGEGDIATGKYQCRVILEIKLMVWVLCFASFLVFGFKNQTILRWRIRLSLNLYLKWISIYQNGFFFPFSVEQVIAPQAWVPRFWPPAPTQQLDMVVHLCPLTSWWTVDTGGSLGFSSLPVQGNQWAPGSNKQTNSKKQNKTIKQKQAGERQREGVMMWLRPFTR